MFLFVTVLFWSRDSCHSSMNKEYQFPNVDFVLQAFLYRVRFLLTHPVYVLENTLTYTHIYMGTTWAVVGGGEGKFMCDMMAYGFTNRCYLLNKLKHQCLI